MVTPADTLRSILQLFLREGFQVTPEAAEFLSKLDNPIELASKYLKTIKEIEPRPLAVTVDLLLSNSKFKNVERKQISLLESAPEDWDFKSADTQYMTHGIHPYPARMLPQIAERLIRRYLLAQTQKSPSELLVLDPFCGSGTVLAESKRLGLNSIGNDINPLALLLAKVKSTRVDETEFREGVSRAVEAIERALVKVRRGQLRVATPDIPNIRHWFKDDVIRDLAVIRHHVLETRDPAVRDFLKVCFSLTAFETSNIDLRSSRFIRVFSEEKLRRHRPDVAKKFQEVVIDISKRLISFSTSCVGENFSQIVWGDARSLPLEDSSVDLIVTSPPYGEERNTIGYTRWSKLSLYWLNFKSTLVNALEKASLGGRPASLETNSETANKVLKEVEKMDPERAAEAAPFFIDYFDCLRELERVQKKDSYCCIVIGNRLIRRVPVHMGQVTVELGQKAGFSHVKTYYRKIPKKMIPWTGPTGKTIASENIVILKK